MFEYNSKVVSDNIENVWDQHTLDDFNEGKMWYRDANQFSLEVADKYKVTPVVSTGVLSALSPLKEWELNKRLTHNFFTLVEKDKQEGWKKVGHYRTQKEKAWNIYNLVAPVASDVSKILNGLKTVNFFGSINNPDNDENFCIDRHMIKVAAVTNDLTLTSKQYLFLQKEYVNFAKRVNMIPCSVQAILWVTWRRLKKNTNEE